ncbi:serine hydrolase domain-containing protein [Brevundimonas lenta]|uniref:CubicO group peptidase (Beta-lactamase class C family) n=1 Tax=Brevundimonas lenta TaxID=424796 RepID=A0A7W6NQR6_9CAUL|nr:serine hydrolase domain-containing protein [Brevundimonas lenta]MBB4083420.1 CubicO group peptidase (beta-lactamase class C family) [Brevundimonas lenta]
MKRLLATLILALIVSPAPVMAQADPTPPRTVAVLEGPLAAQIDQGLTAAMANGFGGAVVLQVDGRTVLQAGYGYADRERRVPFTAETSAQIGSITKTFTALAVSQLAAEGRLDLEAPVRTWLPGAAEPAASASLHQLMTHTAGLADYCGDDFEPRTRDQLLTQCMALPLAHEPGRSVYSNMGLSIAAAVVESVSGQSWPEYLRDHVWTPFGMTGTGWTFPTPAPGGHAVGYLDDVSQGVISDRIAALDGADWNLRGNGGLQASAADMARFHAGLMASPEAVRTLMLQPHADGDSPGVKEGYGLFFRVDDAGRPWRVGHGGSDGVFFSYLALYPRTGAVLYFVGNNGEAPVRDQLRAVLALIEADPGVRGPTD